MIYAGALRYPFAALAIASLAIPAACRRGGAMPAADAEVPALPAESAGPNTGPLASVCIEGVPHIVQKPDFCGEACAAMAARKLGKAIAQDDVFALSGVPPAEGRGCYTRELAKALDALGFAIGPVWYTIPGGARERIESEWRALHADLIRGLASIVCMRTSDGPDATEHFRLILGYDARSDEVIYHEPAQADGAYLRMPLARFLSLWPLRLGSGRDRTVIRFRLAAESIRDVPAHDGFSPADYAQHVLALRKRLPEGFTLLLEPPFVVLGDEAPFMVRRRADRTIEWAVGRLKALYFEKDPLHILDIWLFKDDASYRKHARELFGDTPSTPYGYYSDRHRALIMNIATGGGTLVHEIVHPFVEANFPSCPAWFNEGLGSLYEQSHEKDGQIRGLTNWRLAGLQEGIRAGRLSTFETLTGTTTSRFYGTGSGLHYAQARYLCYYLQEKGLLAKYYHALRAARAKDPTGYETLKAILEEKDMAAFQKRWEAYVLALTFP